MPTYQNLIIFPFLHRKWYFLVFTRRYVGVKAKLTFISFSLFLWNLFQEPSNIAGTPNDTRRTRSDEQVNRWNRWNKDNEACKKLVKMSGRQKLKRLKYFGLPLKPSSCSLQFHTFNFGGGPFSPKTGWPASTQKGSNHQITSYFYTMHIDQKWRHCGQTSSV